MASIAEVLSDQEKTNWLNACIALNILKSGLKDFVNQEMQRVKTHMFHSAHRKLNLPDTEMCTMCNVACLVPCPTKGYCKRSGKRCTNGHRRCPKNICNEISNLIIKELRHSKPSWANTEAEQWAFNQWQIAKCFLPPDGYTGVGSVEDTDFNGIISVMLNCKTFDLKLSFPIAHNQPNQCLLSKARAFGRAVRHTPNFTMKEDVLQDMFNTLSAILKDPKCLGNDISAQEAERKLNQLRNDKMTSPEMIQLVLYAQNEKKRITEENKIDFRHRLVELYNKLRSVPVFPLVPCNDRPLRKIYCTPILLHIPKHTFGSRTNTEKIRTYMDIIFTNGELNKNVFIQGEPGIGKSIFVAKMVLDWCDASLSKHPSSKKTAFCDIETLLVYKFVFLVTLRDANRQREVIDMIKSQIVDEIYSSEEDRGNAYTIVQQIMKSEMCLVIQDGMDEWSDYNGVNVLPVMVLCHSHSTVKSTAYLNWLELKMKRGSVERS
ncbi:uncharacterized protein LOC127837735 isoform X2 [Dreissena polymorpha]|uniref:4Fe-4S ferredoxin-type domain-containing protein n=1 Tax=Dreissena polymorpha TaxID=45954 RepID=A0A9D4FNG8_DREPO|nr:uncharacterized protein LOC127837735 isoform X2 [Dreissena polymorpha]KAH3800413.1 hypothetical protein DPMN_154046 [Dreissena polymorpha]